MTCTCAFSAWLQGWLGSFGAQAPYVLAALVLLWWGRKALRREHFGSLPTRQAWMRQWPAMALFVLGGVVLLVAQIKG